MSSYGPSLPPHLAKKRDEQEESDSEHKKEEQESMVGPALPPHLIKKRQQQQEQQEEEQEEPQVEDRLGPQDDDEESDDDDDEVIGPMPPKPGEAASSSASADFEARARMMRDKIEEANRPKEHKRETWMLELPEENSKNFGLGPRQFSKSTKDKGKRDHTWTMTPEQRAKRSKQGDDEGEEEVGAKGQDEDVLAYLASLKRDQEMDKVSKELRKKRGEETLMELHDKKLKKKRKEEEEERKKKGKEKEVERRPFDRDLDLQANRFDNAQKELMLKKARQLNDKFSQGATKFL